MAYCENYTKEGWLNICKAKHLILIFEDLSNRYRKSYLNSLPWILIPGVHHFLLINLCLAERNGFDFLLFVFFGSPPFLFTSDLLARSRCSLFLTGYLCCKALSLSIRIQRIINIRKSTNRLKKSWIVSMMWRMLQKRASRECNK